MGELFFTCSELTEVWPHPGLVGYYMCIAGISFGLTAIGVAGSVYGEAGDVEATKGVGVGGVQAPR